MSLQRRDVLKGLAAGLAVRSAKAATRPNIVYLHSHDTGRYIQPYGYPVPTPHLQKFSEQALLFRQAFDAAPTCSPSRASLLSGQCPHSNGMLGLAHRGFSMNDYKQHLLHTLRPADYRSTLIGVQHIAKSPALIGYDEVVPTRNTHVANVAPAAVEWFKNVPKQPFYIEVGFQETHRVFASPGPNEDPRHTEPPAPLPDTTRTREDMAAFKATARILDQGMGDVLAAIEASGLAGNTLVILTTDHGIAFPAMKCNLTQHGTGVMLMLRGPGGFSGGKVVDAMVSHIDLFPTICELLNVERPAWLQGRSLMPLIRGEKQEVNEEIFAEVNYHASYEPMRSVRTQRWNYIRRFGDRRKPVLPNCDDGPSKQEWLDHGWRDRTLASEELYDTMFDPNETRNLVADPSARAVLEEMRGRLERWMKRTGDPLLHGPVKAPAGAVVNDPNGTSPQERTIPA